MSSPVPVPYGDEADLYRRHHHELVRSVRRAVNASGELVEDACQSAWLILLRRQPERGPMLFGWLRTVAIHEAYRLSRAERRDCASRTSPTRVRGTSSSAAGLRSRPPSRRAARWACWPGCPRASASTWRCWSRGSATARSACWPADGPSRTSTSTWSGRVPACVRRSRGRRSRFAHSWWPLSASRRWPYASASSVRSALFSSRRRWFSSQRLHALAQRVLAGALHRRHRCRLPAAFAQALELGAQGGLGVEPLARDAGAAGDGLEADRRALVVEVAQRVLGSLDGRVVSLLGGAAQRLSAHGRPPRGAPRGRR